MANMTDEQYQKYLDSIDANMEKGEKISSPTGSDKLDNATGLISETVVDLGRSGSNGIMNLFSGNVEQVFDERLGANVKIDTTDGSDKDSVSMRARIYENPTDYFNSKQTVEAWNNATTLEGGACDSDSIGTGYEAVLTHPDAFLVENLSPEGLREWEDYKETMAVVSSAQYDDKEQLIRDDTITMEREQLLGQKVAYIELNDAYVTSDSVSPNTDVGYGVEQNPDLVELRVTELTEEFGFSEDIAKRQAIMELSGAYTKEEIAADIAKSIDRQERIADMKAGTVETFGVDNSTNANDTTVPESKSATNDVTDNATDRPTLSDKASIDSTNVEQELPITAEGLEAKYNDAVDAAIDGYIELKASITESVGNKFDTERVVSRGMTKASEDKDMDTATINAYVDLLSDIAEQAEGGLVEVIDSIEALPDTVKENIEPIIEKFEESVESEIESNTPNGVEFDLDNVDFATADGQDPVDFESMRNEIAAEIGADVDLPIDTSVDFVPDLDFDDDIEYNPQDLSSSLSMDDLLRDFNGVDTSLTDDDTASAGIDLESMFG